MKFKNLDGKERNLNISKYLIDWDIKERSLIQYKVKKFLEPYWKYNVVCSEFRIVSTRMTLDIFNVSKKIAVEVQGKQHTNYIKYFAGSRSGYLSQLDRDNKKQKFCDLNGIQLVEIHENEISEISEKWFLETYNIVL